MPTINDRRLNDAGQPLDGGPDCECSWCAGARVKHTPECQYHAPRPGRTTQCTCDAGRRAALLVAAKASVRSLARARAGVETTSLARMAEIGRLKEELQRSLTAHEKGPCS